MLGLPVQPLTPHLRTPISVQELTVTTGLELMELVAFHYTMPSVRSLKVDNIKDIFPFALVDACPSILRLFLTFHMRRVPSNFTSNSSLLYARNLVTLDIMWYLAQATSSLMRYFANIVDLKSIRLASVFGAYTDMNGTQ